MARDFRRRPDDGKSLYLGLSDIAAQAIMSQQYSAWDCLNDAYGASSPQLSQTFGSSSVLFELDGVFNLPLVAALYAQLPGVTTAEPNSRVGDGSTICVAREAGRYEYVVDRAGGDCPAGCTEHEVHRFTSELAGQITALEVWSTDSGEPAPAWFGALCR